MLSPRAGQGRFWGNGIVLKPRCKGRGSTLAVVLGAFQMGCVPLSYPLLMQKKVVAGLTKKVSEASTPHTQGHLPCVLRRRHLSPVLHIGQLEVAAAKGVLVATQLRMGVGPETRPLGLHDLPLGRRASILSCLTFVWSCLTA